MLSVISYDREVNKRETLMKTIDEAFVWEVSTYEFTYLDDEDKDEGYEVGETIDNCYIITEDDDCDDKFFEALIAESGFTLEDCVVQVYQARSASLFINRNDGLDVYEADCSTGCAGSPVYERLVD